MAFTSPSAGIFGKATSSLSGSNDLAGKTLVIEETDIPSPRRIELRGRAMPYQGVAWGGQQRTKRTVYPGNPVASQQILGPEEDGTTMSGTWKDRFLTGAVEIGEVGGGGAQGLGDALGAAASLAGIGNSSTTVLAEALVQEFHAIRRAGTVLRVQYLSEVRFGVLKSFTATYARAQDIQWEMSFEWQAWDDNAPLRSSSEPPTPAALLSALNAVLDAIAAAPDIVRAFTAKLVTLVNKVASVAQILFDIIRTFDALTDLPGTIIGAMIGAAAQLDRQLAVLIHSLADVSWPTTVSAQALAGPSVVSIDARNVLSSPVQQIIKFEAWRRNAAAISGDLQRVASDATAQRIAQRNPQTTRVFVVPAGSTLYDVATKFYGSADFATYLAAVNGLTGAQVPAGFRLRVPPRPTGPSSLRPGLGNCGECC